MKKIYLQCIAFILLFTFTACGEAGGAGHESSEESAKEPALESITESAMETEAEISIQVPSRLFFDSIESLTDAEEILSVERKDHSFPNVDISKLSEEAAEQYRVLLEEYTAWEIRYTVNSTEAIAYAAAPNYYSDDPCPLILYTRGGNGSFGAVSPQMVVSYASQSGCIIIAPEYGEEDEFGGADVENITFWVDVIPELSFVDPDEVWLLGESRGGMEGCLTLRNDRDHVIKAAAFISGVYDLPALYESRTDMREMLTRRIGGTPAECSEEYEKRSAVTFAAEIDTPILLIHSIGDKQVPCKGAVDFAEALADAGNPHDIIIRDNNVHGMKSDEMADIVTWLRENGK